jgi:hypothetical protein
VLIFSLLTFFALFPFTDKSQVDKGKQRVQELQINFDQKIIKDLEAKQKPAEISGTGGRDPFSRF